jgi:hypothetical protein
VTTIAQWFAPFKHDMVYITNLEEPDESKNTYSIDYANDSPPSHNRIKRHQMPKMADEKECDRLARMATIDLELGEQEHAGVFLFLKTEFLRKANFDMYSLIVNYSVGRIVPWFQSRPVEKGQSKFFASSLVAAALRHGDLQTFGGLDPDTTYPDDLFSYIIRLPGAKVECYEYKR